MSVHISIAYLIVFQNLNDKTNGNVTRIFGWTNVYMINIAEDIHKSGLFFSSTSSFEPPHANSTKRDSAIHHISAVTAETCLAAKQKVRIKYY